MKFIAVSEVFTLIEETSSRLEMTHLFGNLLNSTNAIEADVLCNISLGRLYPPYIGTQFGLARKGVIKIVAQFLGKPEQEMIQSVKELGDVGLVLVNHSWECSGNLTVQEVYFALEDIARTSGTGSQGEKSKKLQVLLKKLDPISAKYVVRIILGKLRLGFSDMTIIDALSWMEVGNKSLRKILEHAYNICVDIGRIAYILKSGGIEEVEKTKIHLGIPILMAAAERLPTAQAIMDKIGPTVVAQPKIDGFRLQIHVDNTGDTPVIHFFSRNVQDMTGMFPDLVKAFERIKVKEFICEGEAIAFDPNSGTFLPFQETVKRKRKHDIGEVALVFPLQVFIFDILYHDGESLLDLSYTRRRQIVKELFGKTENPTVRVIEEEIITSADRLLDYFNLNISEGLEGVVVKRPESRYQPGKRNFNWIKLKRQEEGHLDDTLDCVILGYYAGRGKRAGFGIGAFLVGVYNHERDQFETIAKVGTGLKDVDWVDLKRRCDRIRVDRKPVNVVCAKDLYPDVWIYPEIVCLIRADEISRSPLHTVGKIDGSEGYALRFPRIMGYREDKSSQEATTTHEIRQMFKNQYGR